MKAIKIVILNIFFLCAVQLAFSQENLLPIKKPVLSAEIIEKKISKNILIPLKKPIFEQKEKITEIKKKKEEKKISKIQGVILPESKPLIVKKGRAKVSKKSKYYSERDFNYAKQAIQFMEKSNWKDATKVAKKARAKSIYNFIQWQHLLTTGNRASFYDYKEFIERNKNYPRIGRIKYLAEHKMSTQILSPKDIINWFENRKPLSGFGKMVLGESLILTGNNSEGIKLIKEGWITADLSKSDLKFFRKKYKKYLSSDDYIKRADYLAWENKYWDLRRMLIFTKRLPAALYC
jgi:soluble lytic murein transglycosylase